MVNREIPSDDLIRLTDSHFAALLAGSMPEVWFTGSADSQHPWGTMTFIRYGERVLGITCNHVVQHAENTEFPAFMLALGRHTPLTGPLVARSNNDDPDYPFDIAVFELDADQLERAGKTPLLLDDISTPLQEGEIALAVGFLGYARLKVDEQYMTHKTCYISATCHSSSSRKFILYEQHPNQPHDFSVGGMSGGPIFRITSSESFSLAGIIFEGKARADAEHGCSIEDLWIWGFPLNDNLLRDILEHRGVPCNTPTHRTPGLAPRRRR